MNYKINLLRIFMTTQLNYMPLLCVIFVAQGLFGARSIPIFPLLVFNLLPFGLYFVRIYTKTFLSFMFGHIIMSGIWYMFLIYGENNYIYKLINIGYLILMIVLSCYVRTTKEDREEEIVHPGVGMGLFLLIYYLQGKVGNLEFQKPLILISGIYLCTYFFYIYIERYLSFIYVNKRSAGVLSEKQVFLMGGGLALGYTFFVGVLFRLFSKESLGMSLGGYIKQMIIQLLRWLFSRFSTQEEELKIEENLTSKPEEFIPKGEGEPSMILEIIGKIFEILFYFALAFLVVMLMIWLIRGIQKIFRKEFEPIKYQEEKENLVRGVKQRKQEKNNFFFPYTNKGKIRKYYQSYVKKQGKIQQIEHETPRELCGQNLEKEEHKRLCEIYERARYSNLESSDGEVKQMRKAVMSLEREKQKSK